MKTTKSSTLSSFLTTFLILIIVSACRPDDPIASAALENSHFSNVDTIEISPIQNEVSPLMPSDTLRYLALGDSYTIGHGISTDGRWPVQLADSINQRQLGLVIGQPVIIAQTGWTTAALSNAMNNTGVDNETYDLVSLLIGVNNQYQGLSIEEFADEFTELLQRAIIIAGHDEQKVFVVSIPDYGYTPFGASNQASISQELSEFNGVCQAIAQSFNVAHYNITPISQQWPSVEGLIADDGLHPSADQYQLWVESITEGVVQQLLAD